ncbi:site-specific integrase [Lysinibacillus sp. SGAir0095]|uniref:tyrosine-type recombinase/integrase n=1 Tax=Lysinibacillus sp. SGAir0095 TaxID=2070463 RepID=UPI0021051091|nr:site-specific integrase [Lysinibacillus sp. SGAir0095]
MHKTWSNSTVRAYERNVDEFIFDMEEKNIEPIIENVTYEYTLKWVKRMVEEGYKAKTINQKISTLSSLLTHYNNLGVINKNPFAALDKVEDYDEEHHSRALSLEELYLVYKASYELQSRGVNVLIPISIEIFTALRSTSLKKLTVKSVSIEKNGLEFKRESRNGKKKIEESKKGDKGNRKNKSFFLPLPPKSMSLLVKHIEGLDSDDPLLYGLKGKALENKQMNYITNKICEHLKWMEKKVSTNKDTDELVKKEQFFTPHAFRYTLASLLDEMEVERDTIKFLLLHSNKNFDSLDPYILRFNKHTNNIKAAQILLETVLETALELDMNYSIKLNFKDVTNHLKLAYQYQLYNEHYYVQLKEQIISSALADIFNNFRSPVPGQVPQHTNLMANNFGHQMLPTQQSIQQMPINSIPAEKTLDQFMSLMNNFNQRGM